MLKVYNICIIWSIGPKIRMWNGQQDDGNKAIGQQFDSGQ